MTKHNRLIYLPLGGAGEIGMNAYVYGYGPAGKERLIVVDLGVTFPDMDSTPGVDLIMADIAWLEARADRIDGIFITHAHEDHIGAVGHLWPRLKAKIYARRFTAIVGRLKLSEAGLPQETFITAPEWPKNIQVGPFRVAFVPVSHSIPESSALVIDSPAGRVFHTGDFKLDENPIVGEAWSDARITAITQEEPVKVLVCDSTNVFSAHAGRSESTLKEPLRELIAAQSGMVVATTFGSNVARLKSLAEAGDAAGRSICVLGRAMRRMLSAAREAGVLGDFPPTISPEDALDVPRGHLMLLVTGSQGERRAASAQLSRGKYLGLEMKAGDTFLFSSKTIPGNEREVLRIMNAFSEMGVDIVDESDGLYHVSGHANRPDLEHLHRLILPDMLIPMHGEHRHLREHSKLATQGGIISAVVTNGMMVDVTDEEPLVIERIDTGRIYLDGTVLLGALDGVVRERIKLALNGHVMVTVILDEKSAPLGDAWVDISGLPLHSRTKRLASETLERELNDYLERSEVRVRSDDKKLEEAVRRVVRQTTMEEIGKKPIVTVVISRMQFD